jgi:hypothetical protein
MITDPIMIDFPVRRWSIVTLSNMTTAGGKSSKALTQ